MRPTSGNPAAVGLCIQLEMNLEGSVCRSCSLGAIHIGESPSKALNTTRNYGCIRCNRGAGKLLAGCLCMSCHNRAREVITGQNAKGSAPKAWANRLYCTSAIIQTQDAEQFAKAAASKRPRCTLGATALPQWSYFDRSHPWLEFVCTGREELAAPPITTTILQTLYPNV